MAKKDQTQEEVKQVNALVAANTAVDKNGVVLNTMESLKLFADAVRVSGLAPATLDSSAKILVAIQTGKELGLPPMHSLSSIAVIGGRPSLWGDSALALVYNSGLVEHFKEWIDGEGDQMVAHCQAKRKGNPEPIAAEFSVPDAKKAGLWNKQGSWQTHPKRMLKYKARAFCLRDAFPDVLCGLHLTEELEGEVLPAPDCKTPKRADRIPVNSTTRHPPLKAGSDAAGTDAGSAGPVVDEATIRAMVDGCMNNLRDAITEATREIAVAPEELIVLFCKLCAIVLGGEEDDYTKPENYTVEGLTAVNKQIEEGVPPEILAAFETEPDSAGIPIEEAEKEAEEKLGIYHRYKCNSETCCHVFKEPDKNGNCPKCFTKDITDYGPDPDGESEE